MQQFQTQTEWHGHDQGVTNFRLRKHRADPGPLTCLSSELLFQLIEH
jgi:hypothetical protein